MGGLRFLRIFLFVVGILKDFYYFLSFVMLYYNLNEAVSIMPKKMPVRPLFSGLLNGAVFAAIAKFVVISSPTFAEEKRELDSHEHGVGELNIAIDSNTVAMELHAPGADIVGFEYAAESAEDQATIDAAVSTLAQPLDLFIMPAAAECSVTQASAELEIEEGDEHHDEHHDNDDEGHADDHGDENEHVDSGSHTEFYAAYTLTCGNLSALSQIQFAYFDAFENARTLEVQIISASGAQAFEVERENPTLDLRGMF